MDHKTLYRWLEQPLFGDAYRKARRETFTQTIGVSQKYAPMALQALAKIVHDETKPPSARVSAASALLKFSRESLELDDLAARLNALERQVNTPPPPTHQWPPASPPSEPDRLAEAA